jgi:hypothetical protein
MAMGIPSKIRLAICAGFHGRCVSVRTLHESDRTRWITKEKTALAARRSKNNALVPGEPMPPPPPPAVATNPSHDYSSSSLLFLPRACHCCYWQTVSLLVIILEERLVFLASWIVEIYKPN